MSLKFRSKNIYIYIYIYQRMTERERERRGCYVCWQTFLQLLNVVTVFRKATTTHTHTHTVGIKPASTVSDWTPAEAVIHPNLFE